MAIDFPLKIGISAVDRLTGPVSAIQTRLNRITAPFGAFNARLKSLSEASGATRVAQGFRRVTTEGRAFGGELLKITAKAVGLGVALGGALKVTVFDFAAAGDQVAKTALRIGVGIEALQEYRYAAERTGIAQATLDMALQRFGRRVGEAGFGKGEALGAIQALGLSIFDVNGKLRSTEELLPELADKLARIESPMVRNAIAMKFFDSEGVALVQMLTEGSEGLARYREEARRLGEVIREDDARAAEGFQDVLRNLQGALRGSRNEIASQLLPAVRDLGAQLTEMLVDVRPRIAAWSREFMEGMPERLQQVKRVGGEVLAFFRPLVRVGGDLVRRFGPARTVLAGLALVIGGPLIAAFGAAAAAVLAFGNALFFTPFGLAILAIGAIAAGAYAIWRNWKPISAFFARTWTGIQAGAVILWEGLKAGFLNAWDSIKGAASSTWDFIADGVTGLWDRIKDAFTSGWDWIASSKVGRFFLGIADSIGVGGGAPPVPSGRARGNLWQQPPPSPGGRDVTSLDATLARMRAASSAEAERGVPQGKVTVEFKNMPRGVRVAQDPRNDGLDLSQGYAMAW